MKAVAITGCVCGSPHMISEEAAEALRYLTAGKPATVRVVLGARAWLVPRLYVACHGLNGWTLAEEAARYQWPEVPR